MAKEYADLSALSHFKLTLKTWFESFFVSKVEGKGLSSNDFTNEEKAKLSGIPSELPTASPSVKGGVKIGSGISVDAEGTISAQSLDWDNINNKPNKYAPDSHTHEMSDVNGLATALSGKVSTSLLGQANGVATLDASGVIPSAQLPSFVDDVIEGYYANNKFYADSAHTAEIVGATGKIYVDISTNLSYRFGGTTYTVITSSDMVAITNEQIDALFE